MTDIDLRTIIVIRWNGVSRIRVGPLLHLFCGPFVWLMSVPTPLGHLHTCTKMCLNCPLQQCGDVCGIVAIIFAAVLAVNEAAFHVLMQPKTPLQSHLLPTADTLQQVFKEEVIAGFVTGVVDVAFVSKNADTADSMPSSSNPKRKNKRNTSTSHSIPLHHHPKRERKNLESSE